MDGPDIRAIIISPTRELAEQIAVEAQKVVRNTGVIVQTAVGGSAKTQGLRKIQREGCHILVGTPGRLKDILSDPYSQVRAPKLSAFVLDEADRLLDQGFAPDIQEIQDLLPRRSEVDRQTLLFSATVPREVMSIVAATMKPDFKFVRTVQEGEQQTHEKVPQKAVNVGGFENVMPALLELCKRELAREDGMPFKALVYFGTTAEVALASAIFQNLQTPGAGQFTQHPLHPARIIEIHAKLTQLERTRAADTFRRAECAVMLSSDVTARGMDFPNVTHVIQIGLPTDRDTYIHRIGRTARGDKKGEAWLLITEMEADECARRLHALPILMDTSLETGKVDMTQDAHVAADVAATLTQAITATKTVPMSHKSAAYLSALGMYGWHPRKQVLIDSLNNRAKFLWGLETPPRVAALTVRRLGLSHVRGLNIAAPDEGREDGGFGGSGRGFDRGGSSGGYDRGSSRGGFNRGSSSGGGYGGDRGAGRSSYGGDRGGSSYGGDRGAGRSSYGGDRGDRSSYGGDRGGSSYGGDRGAGRSSYGGDRGQRSSYGGGRGAGAPHNRQPYHHRGRTGGDRDKPTRGVAQKGWFAD